MISEGSEFLQCIPMGLLYDSIKSVLKMTAEESKNIEKEQSALKRELLVGESFSDLSLVQIFERKDS
ncbi:unnamed protein product [Camellia sinensis]